MSSPFIRICASGGLDRGSIINALLRVVMGLGIGFAYAITSQWWDRYCQSDYSQEDKGRNVGEYLSSSERDNHMLIAGLTFGWKYALYSMITIFVSSRA